MYAFALEKVETRPAVDFKLDENSTQFHYWRKHPNLHGLMQKLYETKGGTNPEFNCDTLSLNTHDLDAIEAAITGKNLPETRGFFFGESTGEELNHDLDFIAKARKLIENGKDIVYYSWW